MVAKQRNNLGNTRRGLMKRGMLSDHFAAFAAKRLSVVDADPEKSNQHEVTGSKELRQILGEEDRKKENRFPANYIISEESRVGKECVSKRSSRWAPSPIKKKNNKKT